MWQITAYGASGGFPRDGAAGKSGRGAKVEGMFPLRKGDKIHIVVGQHGGFKRETGAGSSSHGGGGGGGSFIWKEGTTMGSPLLVAGGGGGASFFGTSDAFYGQPGAATESGTDGSPSGGVGGRLGKGGSNDGTSEAGRGGAGAGWYADGDCDSEEHACGLGYPNFSGGYEQASGFVEGGFGGGGGTRHEGGGGGGYSGGGGGAYVAGELHGGGGGGGSFINNQSVAVGTSWNLAEGANTFGVQGDGQL